MQITISSRHVGPLFQLMELTPSVKPRGWVFDGRRYRNDDRRNFSRRRMSRDSEKTESKLMYLLPSGKPGSNRL